MPPESPSRYLSPVKLQHRLTKYGTRTVVARICIIAADALENPTNEICDPRLKRVTMFSTADQESAERETAKEDTWLILS
jgi:hypothetical protein